MYNNRAAFRGGCRGSVTHHHTMNIYIYIYIYIYIHTQKVQLSRYTPWWRLGERRYSSYSFLTSSLGGGEWSASRPGLALPRRKDCSGGWVGLRADLDTEVRGKILCSCLRSNPDRPVVQSVVRHYTDWATLAPMYSLYIHIREICRFLCCNDYCACHLDPRFAGSSPAVSDGFLRAIKIRSTASFGGEVKPSVPCRKILRHVKDPLRYDRDTDRQNSAAISYQVSPRFATRYLL
jgi:hypothetical protein